MTQTLQPHEKAARIIRLMGWLILLMSVGIAAAILLPVIHTGKALPLEMYAVLGLSVIIPISLFFVARGIFARQEWARWAGFVYAVLALFGVPVGTFIGGYVLWQLKKGWPKEAAQGSLPK